MQRTATCTGLTRQLIALAAPIVLSNLAYTLLGVVDTAFMGRVGTLALGAVGLANITYLTAAVVLRSATGGTLPFVARTYGAGDLPAAGRYLKHFIVLALAISPMALVLPWFFRLFFAVTKPDHEVAAQAMAYMNIRLIELPFALVHSAVVGFLIGIGNSRLPMALAWLAVSVNLVANYVLVFGKLGLPALGLIGAAWGTVIAVTVQTAAGIIIVYSRYRVPYRLTKLELPTIRDIASMVKVGLPLGLGDGIDVGAFSVFFALISRLGTAELAASEVANQITAIAFMPGLALGSATGSLVGRYIGAGKPSVAEAAGYRGVALGVGVMGVAGILFLTIPRLLIAPFTHDPDVIKLGIVLLRVMAFYQIFDAMNIIFRGALNGAGDTRFTFVATTVTAWGIFIPGAYLAAFKLGWGIAGAWIGALAYLVTLGIISALRFRSGRWKSIKLSHRTGELTCPAAADRWQLDSEKAQ